MKRIVVLLFALVYLSVGVQAQFSNPQQTLQQYVADLQKNPNDTALREKIIKLALEVKPAVPEEARRHYVMAKTLFEAAKKPEDFGDSIAEFKAALLIAPWWPEANRNLGLALEAAQRFDEAITYVKLYMTTNPGEENTRAAQDEIYKIEAKKRLAGKTARESSPEVPVAKGQSDYDAWLKDLDSARFVAQRTIWEGLFDEEIRIHGTTVIYRQRCLRIPPEAANPQDFMRGQWLELGDGKITGRAATIMSHGHPYFSITISEDGKSLVAEWGRVASGPLRTIFYRE